MSGKKEEIKSLLAQANDALKQDQSTLAEARLDELLSHELDILTEGELIERATALKQKIQLRRNLGRNAILIAVTVLANAALIGFLVSTPVSSVAIDGTIETHRLDITVEQDTEFTPPAANSATISSPESFEIDAFILDEKCINEPDCSGKPTTNFIETVDTEASFTLDGRGIKFEYITAYPNTDITLLVSDELNRELTFKLNSGRYEGEILIDDIFTLDCNQLLEEYSACDPGLRLKQSGGIILKASGNSRIDLFLSEVDQARRISENVYVNSIGFETQEPRGKTTSNINQGMMRLLSYAGDPVKLQKGDFLEITPEGIFRILQISVDDAVSLRVTGNAKEFSLNGRQLKPSLLQWLQEHSTMYLFIGALLSLTSFILPILQRTNILRET